MRALEDTTGVVKPTKGLSAHSQGVKYHHVRENVEDRTSVTFRRVQIAEHPSDILAKPLTEPLKLSKT